MQNPPSGWPRLSSALFYDDASAAIDMYQVEDPEGHRWWFAQRMSTGGR